MTESELKPCPNPWCEADERDGDFRPQVQYSNFGLVFVSCTSCTMSGPTRNHEIEAIAAWNTRTHPPEYARLIEAAEAVEAEISRSVTRGNSPGHGHQIDGVWDDDSSNGRNAGKPCEWCAQWHEFAAALAAIKETDNAQG